MHLAVIFGIKYLCWMFKIISNLLIIRPQQDYSHNKTMQQECLLKVQFQIQDLSTVLIQNINLEKIRTQVLITNNNRLQCKTCTGPTKYDCASCFDEQNRYLQSDLHQCFCKSNNEESDGLICKQTFLSTIIRQKELYKEFNLIEVQNIKKCNYVYFEVWKDLKFLGCIKCPYFGQGYNSVNCINCILNSPNWYLNPICNIDYRTDDSKYYYNQQLDYQSQEIFIINFDLMATELCHECEQITETKNSRSIIKNVNGFNTYYQCKQYLYPKDHTCQLCEMNCIKCKDTEKCLECNQGFYIKNEHCYQCSQGCLSCILDAELEQVKCYDCQQNYSLVNDNNYCQKCGELCQICQKKLNQDTGQEYMRCLKCNFNAYISLDGESCYYNNLNDCKYPLQLSIVTNAINTLFYDFQPLDQNILKLVVFSAHLSPTQMLMIVCFLYSLNS